MSSAIAHGDRFAFGLNWRHFVERATNAETRGAAEAHIRGLLDRHPGPHVSFLDVGCGSGLFLRAAAMLGFRELVGFDLDHDSLDATRRMLATLPPSSPRPGLLQGDVVDRSFVQTLGTYSWVYAWGSLHHTGAMWDAIVNAASCVAHGGVLVLGIYNRSVTSAAWRKVKRLYVRSSLWLQRLMVYCGWVIAAAAKTVYTGANPFEQRRGMSFYYDIVDWLGGYPYEYATREEVIAFVEGCGFALVEFTPGRTPIACNEFVFRRTAQPPRVVAVQAHRRYDKKGGLCTYS